MINDVLPLILLSFLRDVIIETLGGSYSNIYIKTKDAAFSEGAGAFTFTHTKTQACFCLSFWKCREGECENETPRMRCVIQPHHGGLGQRGERESAHCPHTPHTDVRAGQKAGSGLAKPNMLQHLPKKSENECKLRLFSPARPPCLTLVIQSPSAWWEFTLRGGAQPNAGGTASK